MFAVVQIGSSQYKIVESDSIDVNKIEDEEGQSITLDKVLMYVQGDDVRIGQPFLKGVRVTAKVVRHFLDRKKVAFKFRRRKNSSSQRGHRQRLTAINITKISVA